ncbi:hypothetical protein [Streptomyces sp. AC550_RSS872]|uniref:hypothetical protein n=1 Tax=Streptomyces sp. AC550_RSS872 TaxID=2823689 RepID=UPI001C255258|nr:hypothetical protein [Streptomyces sp. AC550_RSS872]
MNRSLFELEPRLPIDKTNREFRIVRETVGFTAARRLMDEIFSTFPDTDGNFRKEFQTTGFSPRFLELTLYAMLQEQGHQVDRSSAAPDFVIRGAHPVAIEATTTNPPQGSTSETDEDIMAAVRRLIPDDLAEAEEEFVLQAGKAIRRKMIKRDAQGHAYWEKPHVAGVPFAIALEAFHHPSALIFSSTALANYLYGQRDVAHHDNNGRLVITSEQITEHKNRDKKPIPSGLFNQPGSEHLAAVMFTNDATISKFNRMGTERGYGPENVHLIRGGLMYNTAPDADTPTPFKYEVVECEPEERERFSEGFHVFHNPNARHPVSVGTFEGCVEHRLLETGRTLTTWKGRSIFASRTVIIQGTE